MGTDPNDSEPEYGDFEFTIDGAMAEERAANLVTRPTEVWPNWSDGVPKLFRRRIQEPGYQTAAITYHPRMVMQTVELNWRPAQLLSDLKESYGRLPSVRRSQEWSGVYRFFVKDRPLARFLGEDASGTLYLGMAGSGKRKWGILRTRLMQAAKRRDHGAAERWRHDKKLAEKFPWKTIWVEWAFVPGRISFGGGELVLVERVEGYLLSSYRDCFGELPPLNLRT